MDRREKNFQRFTKLILPLIFIVLIIASCTRTSILAKHQKSSEEKDKFNYLGINREGYIELKSGELIHTKFMKLKNDTLEYYSISKDSIKFINTQEVRYAHFNDHFVSAFDGFLFGTLGTGVVLASLLSDNTEPAPGAVLILTGGSILGISTGALIGSKLKFEFEPENIQASKELKSIRNQSYLYRQGHRQPVSLDSTQFTANKIINQNLHLGR